MSTSKTYGSATLLMGERLAPADADSLEPAISRDGSLKVFHSAAKNYKSDSPNVVDVFMSPHFSARAELVTLAFDGTPANGDSFLADVSGDGEWITFASAASNLVPSDNNGVVDVFLYQLSSRATRRISVPNAGGEADGFSSAPSISQDGRFVTFHSAASNLVSNDGNGRVDVFVFDRVSGSLSMASVATNGLQGDGDSTQPAISGDGRWVAFESLATNLSGGQDGNGVSDIFLRDRPSSTTLRISQARGGGDSNGASTQPAISENAAFLSYTSVASDLLQAGADTNGVSDIFLEDLQNASRRRVSVGVGGVEANGPSIESSVANGAQVAFSSVASNLIGAGDQNAVGDIFLHTLSQGTTVRVSVDSDGTEADGLSRTADISASGADVVFSSAAQNLILGVPLETDSTFDLFRHRPEGAFPILCNVPEIADINDLATLRCTSGPPGAAIALYITHVDDIPFMTLLLIGTLDQAGELRLSTTLPNDPTLRGTVTSFSAFVLPSGGGNLLVPNSSFLGIQD